MTDTVEHRDGKASAEVLTELFKSPKQLIGLVQGRVIKRQSEFSQAVQDAVRVSLRHAEFLTRIDRVNRHYDADCFSVPELEICHHFQLVS